MLFSLASPFNYILIDYNLSPFKKTKREENIFLENEPSNNYGEIFSGENRYMMGRIKLNNNFACKIFDTELIRISVPIAQY
jgi:hypothetical protein